jgi:hypothetical protein
MAGEPELQSGSEGEWVTYLQQCLVAIGYLVDSPDGSFGPPTVEAVQRFQATFGLDANGIVGPSTWDALTGAVGQAQRGNVTAAADPQAATSASSDPAASQQSAQQKFEAKLQQHQAKFDELSSGAIAEAKGRLTNVRINCLNASLRFFQQEYQLVEAIQAPKVTKDSSIGAEIAKGLLSVALATVPEYAVTKAVVSVFFNSAANHLGQTAPDPGLDVAAAKNELRTSIGALSDAFSEAVDHFDPDLYGVDEPVKQYLREYLATASDFETLPVSSDVFGWISDQVHIPDATMMDPSYAIFTRLDEELRNAVNHVNSLAAWHNADLRQKLEWINALPASDRRGQLVRAGEDPVRWLQDDDEVNPAIVVGAYLP